MVTLKATADGEMDTHDVTVTVTDVEEMVTGDPLLAEYDPDGDGTIEKDWGHAKSCKIRFFADGLRGLPMLT